MILSFVVIFVICFSFAQPVDQHVQFLTPLRAKVYLCLAVANHSKFVDFCCIHSEAMDIVMYVGRYDTDL